MPRRSALVVLLALLFFAAPARAHQSSVTYSRVVVAADGSLTYQIDLSSRDLFEALGLDRERDASDEEIRAGRDRLFAYVRERLHVGDGPRDLFQQCGGAEHRRRLREGIADAGERRHQHDERKFQDETTTGAHDGRVQREHEKES